VVDYTSSPCWILLGYIGVDLNAVGTVTGTVKGSSWNKGYQFEALFYWTKKQSIPQSTIDLIPWTKYKPNPPLSNGKAAGCRAIRSKSRPSGRLFRIFLF